jgi:REP element-mobilizing transposase RayT
MSLPRHHPPEVREYHCVSKCVDDQFLLTPTPEMAFHIARSWQVTQDNYDFTLAAAVTMSNHGHDLVQPGATPLPAIMQLVKSQIARRANRILGRSGAFYMRRYDATAILDAAASENALHYAHANPVRAHLVERAIDWFGFSTYRAFAEGKDCVSVTWFDEKTWRSKGAKEDRRAKYTHTATVRIGLPLAWQGLSQEEITERRRALCDRMEAEERTAAQQRRENERPIEAHEAITAKDPRSRPEHPKKASRRERAAGARSLIEQLAEAYEEVLPKYYAASEHFRRTGELCPFPAGTYPPWLPQPFEVM